MADPAQESQADLAKEYAQQQQQMARQYVAQGPGSIQAAIQSVPNPERARTDVGQISSRLYGGTRYPTPENLMNVNLQSQRMVDALRTGWGMAGMMGAPAAIADVADIPATRLTAPVRAIARGTNVALERAPGSIGTTVGTGVGTAIGRASGIPYGAEIGGAGGAAVGGIFGREILPHIRVPGESFGLPQTVAGGPGPGEVPFENIRTPPPVQTISPEGPGLARQGMARAIAQRPAIEEAPATPTTTPQGEALARQAIARAQPAIEQPVTAPTGPTPQAQALARQAAGAARPIEQPAAAPAPTTTAAGESLARQAIRGAQRARAIEGPPAITQPPTTTAEGAAAAARAARQAETRARATAQPEPPTPTATPTPPAPPKTARGAPKAPEPARATTPKTMAEEETLTPEERAQQDLIAQYIAQERTAAGGRTASPSSGAAGPQPAGTVAGQTPEEIQNAMQEYLRRLRGQ